METFPLSGFGEHRKHHFRAWMEIIRSTLWWGRNGHELRNLPPLYPSLGSFCVWDFLHFFSSSLFFSLCLSLFPSLSLSVSEQLKMKEIKIRHGLDFMATASQNLLFQLHLPPYHLLQQLAQAKSKCNMLLKCYVSSCTHFRVVLAGAGGVGGWKIRCFSYCFNYRELCLGKGSGARGTSSLIMGMEDSQGTRCNPPLSRFWSIIFE